LVNETPGNITKQQRMILATDVRGAVISVSYNFHDDGASIRQLKQSA
jgi:hypothetical protein